MFTPSYAPASLHFIAFIAFNTILVLFHTRCLEIRLFLYVIRLFKKFRSLFSRTVEQYFSSFKYHYFQESIHIHVAKNIKNWSTYWHKKHVNDYCIFQTSSAPPPPFNQIYAEEDADDNASDDYLDSDEELEGVRVVRGKLPSWEFLVLCSHSLLGYISLCL